MRLYWVEIKSLQILYTIIKICLLFTIMYFLVSLLTSHIIESTYEQKELGFVIKNKERIGICLDTKENTRKFKLMQGFFNTVLSECPCCLNDKNIECNTLSQCKKCKYFFDLLQNEKCSDLKAEDFDYLEKNKALWD